MNYFGTSLTEKGHYFYNLQYGVFGDRSLSFPKGVGIPITRYKEWPFNPEELPKSRCNGDVEYWFINGDPCYSIIAICGSCIDTRPGCKSVFFLLGEFSKEEMINKILSIPIAKKIIDKMPFEVKWN